MRVNNTIATIFIISIVWNSSPKAQQPLTENDFNIDVVTGPVLGSSRIVGMGGAYTPLAEGIDGVAWNPAAYGSRYPFEQNWFEWDISFSLFKPGVFGQDDFFNNGAGVAVEEFLFINLGLRLQFGNLGIGIDTRIQEYITSNNATATSIDVVESHVGLAYGLFSGQLVVGLGGRIANMVMKTPQGAELVDFSGDGWEIGALLRLEDKPWRIGIASRLPVESVQRSGNEDLVTAVQGYVLPEKVYMPWEIQFGLAWQFGEKPLNMKWKNSEDPGSEITRKLEMLRCKRKADQVVKEMKAKGEDPPRGNLCPGLNKKPNDQDWWAIEIKLREVEDLALSTQIRHARWESDRLARKALENIPREYWLFSTELLLIGPTEQGVGMDGFLQQVRRESGRDISIGIRLGAETEPVVDLLKLRMGMYLEPARSNYARPRLHATTSLDIRLFQWDFFEMMHPFDMRVSLSGDFADGYIDMGVGIGFWH